MNLNDEYIVTQDWVGYLSYLVDYASKSGLSDNRVNEMSDDELTKLFDTPILRQDYIERIANTPMYRDWEYNKMMPVVDHGMHDDY